MPRVIIEIKVLRDASEIPTGIEYFVSGIESNSWLGLFINDDEVFRFQTDKDGNASGKTNSVSSKYYGSLDTLCGFGQVLNNATLPKTSVIAQVESLVEDTFNDGLTNVGNHILDLRYV